MENNINQFEMLQDLIDISNSVMDFDISKIFILPNGYLRYNGDISFHSFIPTHKVPKGMQYFSEVGGRLDFSNTKITSLTGLENLVFLKFLLITKNIKSFDGLNPNINIDAGVYIANQYATHTLERNPEFLEWKKSKQIQEISKLLECV